MTQARFVKAYIGVVAGTRFFCDEGVEIELDDRTISLINADQPGTIPIAQTAQVTEANTRIVSDGAPLVRLVRDAETQLPLAPPPEELLAPPTQGDPAAEPPAPPTEEPKAPPAEEPKAPEQKKPKDK